MLTSAFVDKAGATATIVGLSAMMLLGFSALGTEGGYWYFKHRNLQNAADSAAMSAVAALLNIPNPDAAHKTQATSEAQATAARYGFVDTQGGVTVAVNIPPTSGSHTTDPNAVEVIITQPEALFLSSALKFGGTAMFSTKPTQTVRAVANPGTNGNGCVVTLDKSDVEDVSLNGNTTVNLTGCDLYVNSDATNALNETGNATVNARAAYITGQSSGTSNTNLTTTVGTFTGTAPINDPYAGLPSPYNVGSTCTPIPPDQNGSSVVNLSPPAVPGGVVVWCNGWQPTNGNIHLAPGLYVIWGAPGLSCNNCTISGSNVTIFLTGSGTNYAGISMAGTSSLNISAPTDAYVKANPGFMGVEGIAIFGDRNDPCSTTNGVTTCSVSTAFSGGATAQITGVTYLPNQTVTLNGNGTAGAPGCSQIIAFSLTFHGNSGFQNDCSAFQDPGTGAGVLNIGAIPAQLVE